ncbi:hypothetical protein BT69DRAFT_145616 [Atractiella rhizophila]|nr:hypothetical protein BT69DRAFT_145616 [Atractiella rhizophila]
MGHDLDLKRILNLVKLLPHPEECEAVVTVITEWILTKVIMGNQEENATHTAAGDVAEDALASTSFVERLVIALKAVPLHVRALGEGPFFDHVTHKASTHLVNTTVQAANLLSLYIDDALRKQEDPLEGSLDDIVHRMLQVYSFLEAKDVFLELHGRRLARRIVRFECMHEEKEREVARLVSGGKSEHGRKIIQMLAGSALSYYNVRVLSASVSCFPPSEVEGIRLPKELEALHDEFKEFFAKEQRGRKLTHLLHLSTVELETQFTNVKYTIHASVPQAAILLLFADDKTSADLATIANEVGLSEAAAKPLLQVLVKHKLVLFEHGEFRLNLQFISKKIRIPLHRFKTGKDGDDASLAMKQVGKSRALAIEAAVVRVMKCSRQLTRQNLVTDTIMALDGQFKPAIKDINKAIRLLVEKEFLSKIDGETEKYAYVA